MGFTPDYTRNILSESEFTEKMPEITRRLEECRTTGYFDSFDGKPLYYEYFLAEGSVGSIVMVHGCSEFTKKFYEAAFYFLNQGYHVFMYDQRGHGLSFRMAEPVQLVHVDRFRDYVEDLACFIREIVLPLEDRPLYLYSHSMGGAVSALLLAQYELPIQKAVFSAPMIRPVVRNVPGWLARSSIFVMGHLTGWKKRIWIARDFDPDRPCNPEMDPSEVRYHYYLGLRRAEERYQSTPLSLGWNREALRIYSKILRRAKRIRIPVLLLSAEKDQVVRNDYQKKFAERLPDCKMVVLENATHAMLAGTQKTIAEHIGQTLDFFA